jgi:YjbE family integral membrane protein
MPGDLALDQQFLTALINIIIIDLVLSGDNAVVIAMAVQHLPPNIARKAAILGAMGAVGLRVIFTALAAFLLAVPLLQAIGGAVLFWIAYSLLIEKEEDDLGGKEVHSFGDAIRIIIMADVVMSLDNVLAVGGAAHGDLRLLLFGLALSIPLVLFGSSFLTGVLRKWPVLGYLGSAVLAWTAGRMIVHDKVVHGWLAPMNLPLLDNLLPSMAVTIILALGYFANERMKKQYATAKAARTEAAAETGEPAGESR